MLDAPTIRKLARRLHLAPLTVHAVLLAADEELRSRESPELKPENADALARYYGLPVATVHKLLAP